jgi:hypothetical protein
VHGLPVDKGWETIAATFNWAGSRANPEQKEKPHEHVLAEMSMSLDGYVADQNDGVHELHAWYGSGEVETPTGSPGLRFAHRRQALKF